MNAFIIFTALFIYFLTHVLCNTYSKSTDLVDVNSLSHSVLVKRSTSQFSVPRILLDIPICIKYQYDSYNLKCGAIGNPTPVIKWYTNRHSGYRYNNFTQIHDSDLYMINSDGRLDFANIAPTVPISYFCSATNVFGTVYSRKSEIQRIQLPKDINIVYETMEIYQHEKAVIECIMKPDGLSNDFPVKNWEIKFNDEPPVIINKTTGRFSVINFTKVPQLHIRNVSNDDFSNLRVKCVLENKFLPGLVIETAGWTSPKKFTDVYYSANLNFNKCMGTVVSVMQGSDIELPWCSSPTTSTIMWFKSNSSDNFVGRTITMNFYKFRFINHRYGNLLIRNVDVSDEGFYFVKKEGKALKDYVPFELRVTVKIAIDIIKPDRLVASGESVTFKCVITGYPVTDIFWLHNGQYQHVTTNVANKDSKPKVSILEIRKVNTDTAGVYQCVAESRMGLDNRIIDFEQQSASVIINEMSPYLVSQSPVLHSKNRYATGRLDSSTSVLKIQCSFNSTPKASIEWYLDDKPIPIIDSIILNISKHEPYTNIATLKVDLNKLSSIEDKWKYGGMYVAKATNDFGTAECKTLVFVEGVFMIRDHGPITIKHNQKWVLKCFVISATEPEISWFKIKNGNRIKFPESHLEFESSDRREIAIQQVDKSRHDASYECVAMIGGKKVTQMYNVSVAMPPLGIISFAEEATLNERSKIEANCQPLSTTDLPWYSWWEFHPAKSNGKVIFLDESNQEKIKGLSVKRSWLAEQDSKYDYSELPSGVPSLLRRYPNTFSKLQVTFSEDLHMSNVTCVVQNNAGIVKRSIRIIVAVIEFNVTPPLKLNVTLGDSFILNCSPKPNQLEKTIIWKNDTIPIPLYNPGKPLRIYRYINGTLVVKNMTDGDPSEFLCMINSSSTVSPISRLVKILLHVPAQILDMPDVIEVVQDSDYQLVCRVYGDPYKMNISWYKEENGVWVYRPATTSETHKNKVTNLSVQLIKTKNEDGGRYKCQASNAYRRDHVEKIVRVEIVDVPGVVSLKTSNIKLEARTMYLEWTSPHNNGNKPIISYLVTWQWANSFSERNVTDTHVTIDNLHPNYEYNVSIRALNGVGLGPAVSAVWSTLPAAPDGPVLALRAIANSSTSLVLTWKPPDVVLQNGIITQYEVCHRHIKTTSFALVNLTELNWPISKHQQPVIGQTDSKKPDVVCQLVNETKRVLTDLPKFAGYAFRIGSKNAMGMGPYVYTKQRTMEDLPSLPPVSLMCSKITPTTISLQWNPPPQDSINGVLCSYTVKLFRPEHFGVERDRVYSNVTHTNLVTESLVPYSSYSIQVAVTNNIGTGPPSAPLICVTGHGKPSPPGVVKAFPYNISCVIVVWTPPAATNGPIQQYIINVVDNNKQISLRTDTKQNYYTHKVCGLSPNSKYKFKVTAFNTHVSAPTISAPVQPRDGDNSIISIPRDIVITGRATIVLDCETIHDTSDLKWYRYTPHFGQTIMDHHETNGSLIVLYSDSVRNSTYECRLNGHAINYTVSVMVIPDGTPLKPEIYYHSPSTNSVLISWRSAVAPRPDDIVKSFHILVYYKEKKIKQFKVAPEVKTYTITDLTCGTDYDLQLVASYSTINSSADTLRVRTLGSKPQWANTALLLANEHPQSLCFRLNDFEPGDACPVDKYTIKLTPTVGSATEGPQLKVILQRDVRLPCMNVTNLHPSTEYRYDIEATNNAGTSLTFGYAKTLAGFTGNANINRSHDNSLLNMFFGSNLYIILIVVVICAVVIIPLVLYYKRRCTTARSQPSKEYQNNLTPLQRPPPVSNTQTPSMIHRNRKLPDRPSNPYDAGKSTIHKTPDYDDDMKPYATYAPLPSSDPLSSNSRVPPGKKSHDTTAYNSGSQAHSYQYPEMVPSGSNAYQSVSSKDMHANVPGAIESYDNPVKSTMLLAGPHYSKGYSAGANGRCSILQPPPPESICHEPYRQSGSTWSGTTGSSTRELTAVFQRRTAELPEHEEENCSTTRGVNHSTLTTIPNRMLQTNDSNHNSYLDSVSSFEDHGIQNFTQERFPGQQAVEPRFTHTAPAFTRQSSSASSTYDTVDALPHRNMSSIAFNDQQRFLRQETLTEEDESNNFQNQFVIV